MLLAAPKRGSASLERLDWWLSMSRPISRASQEQNQRQALAEKQNVVCGLMGRKEMNTYLFRWDYCDG